MRFVKMHGLGNDFLLLTPEMLEGVELSPSLVCAMCDRHFGVGADGVIEVLPSRIADVRMRMWNADGSEAEMCGNGVRCLAKLAFERGVVSGGTFRVETKSGIVVSQVTVKVGKVTSVLVDMGEPRFRPSEVPVNLGGEEALDIPVVIEDEKFLVNAVSLGNPHAVIFGIPKDWKIYGPKIEHHPLFPNRTNVEFVEIVTPSEVTVKVWERGAGPTLACGTGACAVVAVGVKRGFLGRDVFVHLPGGVLRVFWKEDNHLYLEGPAQEVFEGVLSEEVLDQWISPSA
ncbi:MAG: diaminopimelate epimerase [Candidatus Caldatribacteriaceae bacterium]